MSLRACAKGFFSLDLPFLFLDGHELHDFYSSSASAAVMFISLQRSKPITDCKL